MTPILFKLETKNMYHFNVSPLGNRDVEIHQLEFQILEHKKNSLL
jgi:hypothetical protein